MTINEIYAIIIASAPAITAVIGIIFAVIKGIRNNKDTVKELKDAFEDMREEVVNTKEYEELKAQYKVVMQENIDLKRKFNELLTKMDRVYRGEED